MKLFIKILFFLIISLPIVVIGMEQKKESCLSNEDVTDTMMNTHWQHCKDKALRAMREKKHEDGNEKVDIESAGVLIGTIDILRGRVTTYFPEGTMLTLSFQKFKERLGVDGEKD